MCRGLYAKVPDPAWIDNNPGVIGRFRALLAVKNDPRFWREHPLLAAWPSMSQRVDQRIIEIFSKIDIVKADEIADVLLSPSNARTTHVLEIGAGACLVAAMVLRPNPQARYSIVDLPESIPTGFLLLSYLFPDLDIALPGGEGQVTFYTPDMKPAGPFSAAVNSTSFQELDPPIVEGYFRLIDEALQPGGVFICVNRDVKIDADRNLRAIFDEYPWPENYDILQDDESIISRWSGPQTVVRRRVIRKL